MGKEFKITKPVRLIELFSGYGSQLMAMKRLGVDVIPWKTSEWEVNCVKSYKAVHMPDNNTDYSEGMSKEDLMKVLFHWGVSTNGKEPMGEKSIARKGEKWLRETYNNFIATHNVGSITNVHTEDLEIERGDEREKNKYTYVLTYSFP